MIKKIDIVNNNNSSDSSKVETAKHFKISFDKVDLPGCSGLR